MNLQDKQEQQLEQAKQISQDPELTELYFADGKTREPGESWDCSRCGRPSCSGNC